MTEQIGRPISRSNTLLPHALGQRTGSIFQFAYTTADARETALAWTATLGIGPWFVRGPFHSTGAQYRGAPSKASFTVARTFDGDVMIELIQQHDTHPSVFHDHVALHGFGFHHVAVLAQNFAEQSARYTAACGPAVFEDTLPTGSEVAFFEGAPGFPGFVELVESTPGQESVYQELRESCQAWDGAEPWRAS